MIDEYLIGQVNRISPEAPVPVVEISEQTQRLGGAANVALNVTSLGCDPIVMGIVGSDFWGDRLIQLLSEQGINNEGVVRVNDRPTTVKTRIIGDSQHITRVDHEKNIYLNDSGEKKIIDKIDVLLQSVDGIILEDYNKGVLTEKIIRYVIEQANKFDKIITVDPKFKNFLNYKNVTVFKPNIKETEEALAVSIGSDDDLVKAGKSLKDKLKAKSILITRGSDGMSLFQNGDRISHVETKARKVADVSGAGDTVISTLTAALIGGATVQEASTIANFAAGIVCEEIGIVPVDKNKLYESCLGNRAN